MNPLESSLQTPLRYKRRSPIGSFLSKNKSLFSRNSNCQAGNLISFNGDHHHSKLKDCNSFQVFPVVKTPPGNRFSKVVNPFEAALADRLHLPIIGSPSLFQRPQTPQLSSTQFTWTIEDVSSLQPADLEPHETQFCNSPDPEYEAKAQSAISSYFKEQQIVPSPIDCPLRSQRIILSEMNCNTPISKPGRRTRDTTSQTALSLPPKLPSELEAALAPYFINIDNPQSTDNLHSTADSVDYDLKDASLRRKLFDHHIACAEGDAFTDDEDCVLNVCSPPPKSPDIVSYKHINSDEQFSHSKLPSSAEKSLFGSLSPIVQHSSPRIVKQNANRNGYNGCELNNFEFCQVFDNENNNFNKESQMCLSPSNIDESIGLKKSYEQLPATEVSMMSVSKVQWFETCKKLKRASLDVDLFEDETQDLSEDDMQVSQLSALSNISSESDTPRSKRRSASRKNLSQSFSFHCPLNTEEDYEGMQVSESIKTLETNEILFNDYKAKSQPEQTVPGGSLCRTDSGFNEMTSSGTHYNIKSSGENTVFGLYKEQTNIIENQQLLSNDDADISMMRCSTPS